MPQIKLDSDKYIDICTKYHQDDFKSKVISPQQNTSISHIYYIVAEDGNDGRTTERAAYWLYVQDLPRKVNVTGIKSHLIYLESKSLDI